MKFKIYRTIIFPVVLYGFGNWSLSLTQERGLRVFDTGKRERERRGKRGTKKTA
jgi:hypothetical protein